MIRRIFDVVLLMVLLAGCSATSTSPGADGIGDPFYPQLGNGGYDALHYTLELSIDPRNNSLSGSCTMEARATQPLSSFHLDFYDLSIQQITVNERHAKFEQKEHELTIKPAVPISEGEVFTVTVDYSGSPEDVPAYGTWWSAGWHHNEQNEIYASNETSGAATWYPVNDHPQDKAGYSFRITVPKPYVVAANGLLEQELDHGDSITYVWQSVEPMASYVVGISIAEYEIETEQGPNGILIRNYLPINFPDSSKGAIVHTADMLAFFDEQFGPYPFKAYGTVIVDIPEIGAMETQTLSQHNPNQLSEYVIAHELAHQWFGDSVSLDNWQDIWLKEGASSYAGWLWLEHRERGALDAKVRSAYSLQSFSPNPPGDPLPTNLYTDTVFDRGAITFHALRLRVGDEVFFPILQTYLERYRYGNASTADFISVAEDVSGKDLDEFFDGWLYAPAIPDIPEMGLD